MVSLVCLCSSALHVYVYKVEQGWSTMSALAYLLSDSCSYHEVVIESDGAVARTVQLFLLESWLNADLALLET
jgi:hypothetical protein